MSIVALGLVSGFGPTGAREGASIHLSVPSRVLLSGAQLKAANVAFEGLITDLETKRGQKEMTNYRFTVSEGNTAFTVHLVPRISDLANPMSGGQNEYGREMKFVIEKGSYRILKRLQMA